MYSAADNCEYIRNVLTTLLKDCDLMMEEANKYTFMASAQPSNNSGRHSVEDFFFSNMTTMKHANVNKAAMSASVIDIIGQELLADIPYAIKITLIRLLICSELYKWKIIYTPGYITRRNRKSPFTWLRFQRGLREKIHLDVFYSTSRVLQNSERL